MTAPTVNLSYFTIGAALLRAVHTVALSDLSQHMKQVR